MNRTKLKPQLVASLSTVKNINILETVDGRFEQIASAASHNWWKFDLAISYRRSQGPRPEMDLENILVVVAGGPGAFMALLRSAGGGGGFNNAFVTKKIEPPKNWDKLVAKYESLVPVYARY